MSCKRYLIKISSLGRAEWMRDDALNRIQDTNTYSYEIYNIENEDCTAESTTARKVWGRNFLEFSFNKVQEKQQFHHTKNQVNDGLY